MPWDFGKSRNSILHHEADAEYIPSLVLWQNFYNSTDPDIVSQWLANTYGTYSQGWGETCAEIITMQNMTEFDRKVRHDWDHSWKKLSLFQETSAVAWDLMDADKEAHLLKRLGDRRGLLLEVGCGAAHLSARLAASGFTTVCLDSSKAALALARETYHDSKQYWRIGIAADAYSLPYQDAVFDGVLSTGLLEHFQKPVPLIKEMVRIVKPGGFVYADILPKKTWRLLLLFTFLRPLLGRQTDSLFEMPFRRDDILRFATEAGLKDIEIFPAGIYWPIWSVLRNHRCLIWLESTATRLTHSVFKRLDGTVWAEIFGMYYFLMGRK